MTQKPSTDVSTDPGISGFFAIRRHGGNAVLFGCPRPEVDLFAACGAERAIRVRRAPFGLSAAAGAAHETRAGFARYGRRPGSGFAAHKPQKVSSNGRSRSSGRGRSWVSGSMKRILSAYLLALTSGMAASVRATRIRIICAVLPLMVIEKAPARASCFSARPLERRSRSTINSDSRIGSRGLTQVSRSRRRLSASRLSQ